MSDIRRTVEAVWRIEGARIVATLARVTGDVGFAEDMAQEALVDALRQWPESGVPRNAGAWLTAVSSGSATMRSAVDFPAPQGIDEDQKLAIGGLEVEVDNRVGPVSRKILLTSSKTTLAMLASLQVPNPYRPTVALVDGVVCVHLSGRKLLTIQPRYGKVSNHRSSMVANDLAMARREGRASRGASRSDPQGASAVLPPSSRPALVPSCSPLAMAWFPNMRPAARPALC